MIAQIQEAVEGTWKKNRGRGIHRPPPGGGGLPGRYPLNTMQNNRTRAVL